MTGIVGLDQVVALDGREHLQLVGHPTKLVVGRMALEQLHGHELGVEAEPSGWASLVEGPVVSGADGPDDLVVTYLIHCSSLRTLAALSSSVSSSSSSSFASSSSVAASCSRN